MGLYSFHGGSAPDFFCHINSFIPTLLFAAIGCSSTFTCSFLYLQCYLFVISYLLFLIQLGLDINPDEMAALGIGGIGIGNDDEDDDEDEDDESLEAELAALQGQSSSRGKKKSNCLVLCY